MTTIGRPAARCSGSPSRAPSSRAGNRSTMPRRDERVRHHLGQAGADERLADGVAHRERVVPVGRHRGVRQDRRDELVAADADDLLGRCRPRRRGRGATSARSPRGRRPRPGSTLSGLVPAATGIAVPGAARSVSMPTRARRSRCSSASSVAPSSRLTAPAGTRRGPRSGSSGSVSTAPARPCRRPTRRSGGPSGPRRGAPAGTPGPSRSAGSPRSAGRSGRPSGGC